MATGEITIPGAANEIAVNSIPARQRRSAVSAWIFGAATVLGVVVLLALAVDTVVTGGSRLSWDFLTTYPSRFAERAGLRSSILGSAWVMGLTAVLTVPIAVATAIWIEEFAPHNRFLSLVKLNLANLAGVPSIIFGILGLAVFVRLMGFGPSIIAGALTLFLMILPMTVIAAQEAIRQVPSGLREGSLALGATEWQTVWHHVLPQALPGIITGVILSISRAVGETAALIMIGAFSFIAFDNTSIFDAFTVLPVQVYNWTTRPQEAFRVNAAAAIIVLMVAVLTFNLAAAVLRERFRR
jgi:phosphate transport system permease protein